jgi:hypothetical protein
VTFQRVLAETGAGAGPAPTHDRKEMRVPTSQQQLRRQEQHEQKLREIRDQVANGKLVIRQMTSDERKRFPPKATKPNARGKRR